MVERCADGGCLAGGTSRGLPVSSSKLPEPLATLRGLMHMINAWERGARRPSERYWLLYLRVFSECANGETAIGGPTAAGARLPRTGDINAMEAAAVTSPRSVDPGDIRALAATVKALEQQIAGLSRRLDELFRSDHGKGLATAAESSG